jgi:predicted GIY-YIG superfamily endonuclease
VSSMAQEPSTNQATSLYQYRDERGFLIYVGITSRGILRQAEHNRRAEWWPFVRTQSVEHFPTRDEALAAERRIIETERPPFNAQHNPDHEVRRAAYLTLFGTPEQQAVPKCGHCYSCREDLEPHQRRAVCAWHEPPDPTIPPCQHCGQPEDRCLYRMGQHDGFEVGWLAGKQDERARLGLPTTYDRDLTDPWAIVEAGR